MPFDNTGTYTPVAGAITANPGDVIRSATWDSMNTDTAAALTTLGTKTGVVTGAVAMISQSVHVSFAAAGDTQLPIFLPPGFTRVSQLQLNISGASGSLAAATFGLFTAAGGGGTAIIAAGTAITVTASADNTANNAQAIATATTISFLPIAGVLFFRVGATAAQTANVQLWYRPAP